MREGPDGNTYQLDTATGQWTRAPGIPDYVRPPQQAPQRAPQTAAEMQYDDLRNRQLSMEISGERNPWQQAQDEYNKKQDELKRQQFEEQQNRAKREAQWKVANDMISQQLQAAPMAQIPGQTHFLGGEPGGLLQSILQGYGVNYNPDTYRAPIINIDPNAAWKKAQGMIG